MTLRRLRNLLARALVITTELYAGLFPGTTRHRQEKLAQKKPVNYHNNHSEKSVQQHPKNDVLDYFSVSLSSLCHGCLIHWNGKYELTIDKTFPKLKNFTL
jgi:hypothetical protein